MNILVPNLGSTSLKRVRDYREAIAQIQTGSVPIHAVAFKAVHAGPRYRGTFLIDDGVIGALEEFLPAAPAHNAIYLTGIRAFRESLPDTPLVAAFETEFHRTMPDYAREYGVPGAWREAGVARYGFHGASHQYVGERATAMLGRPLRLVSCHLGGSSSMCAVDRGRAVDTTMGFSPQSGLENATRHGDLDPFAVLFMMERHGWSVEEVRLQLAAEGGLAGLSGIAGGDVRDVEASGSETARLALAVFAYQVKKTVGAYTAAMGGLDAIAFTGGIGENSPRLRAACCDGLSFLGVRLDPDQNENGRGDRLVSPAESPVAVLAMATNEELIVARRAFAVLLSTVAAL
jgi:acetate kinase